MASRSAKDVAARAVGLAKARRVRRRQNGSREVKYSPELAQEICERIGWGEVWSRMGGTDGMPAYSTIYKWQAQYPEFAQAFALARKASNAVRADEVLAVSMEATKETIQEDRLLVGSLKWHVTRADGLEAKENSWTLGRERRLLIRIRQFERAWREDGTPYVREITPGEDCGRIAGSDGE